MIGERDVAHPSVFGNAVDVLRSVVAVSGIGAPEILEYRKTAVTMQIRPLQRRIRSGVRYVRHEKMDCSTQRHFLQFVCRCSRARSQSLTRSMAQPTRKPPTSNA